MPQNKVTAIVKTRGFEYNGKNFDSYAVQFEGGDEGEVAVPAGSPPPWAVGDNADYTIEPNKNPKYADKVRKAGSGGFGGGGRSGWKPPTWETEKLKVPTMATSVACNALANRWAADPKAFKDVEDFGTYVDQLARQLADTMTDLGNNL